MMSRPWFVRFPLVVGLVCLGVVVEPLITKAAAFVVISQNTLHFGGSKTTDDKIKELKGEFAGEDADVVLLQELTKDSDSMIGQLAPNNYYTSSVSDRKGRGSYKERYGFLVDTRLLTVASNFDVPNNGTFMRPPSGIVVSTKSSPSKKFAILNFHAVYGKHVKLRQAEAAAMAGVVKDVIKMTGAQAVIIGGDWNLPCDDPYMQGLPLTCNPTAETSLNQAGDPSSAYDHFLWTSSQVTLNSCTVLKPGDGYYWRWNVSDHMGVRCKVQY